MWKKMIIVTLATLLAFPLIAQAEDTRFAVRVISQGAKFIGTSMGGVQVTVRDADTGELLAQGVTAGSTGDTDRIMRDPLPPGGTLSTPGSAVYEFTLDLDQPRRLDVTAYGPKGQLQSATEVSTRVWGIPGKHKDVGDGILLELPGFNVDVLAPPAHVRLPTEPVTLEANVTMQCGCPVTPDGLWDANRFQVEVWIETGDELLAKIPMEYAGTASQFKAQWTPPGPGVYQATVTAYDPADGNTGLDRTTFILTD